MANSKELFVQVKDRMSEVVGIVKALNKGLSPEGKTLSKNTCNTQRAHRMKELRILKLLGEILMQSGLKEFALSEDALKGFNQLVAPEGGGFKIVVSAGEKVMDILMRHADEKDVYGKITRYCAKNGLKIDQATGLIVSARAPKAELVKNDFEEIEEIEDEGEEIEDDDWEIDNHPVVGFKG